MANAKPKPNGLSWLNRWSRKLHRWGAIAISIPLLLVVVSGLLLQIKKQSAWVQPPTQRGSVPNQPGIAWESILDSARQVSEAEVNSWEDIERLDVQPGRSLVKVQSRNRWEIQLDLASGEILSSSYRRSDLIESLHDGSFFGDWSKLSIFLGNGLVLFFLWISGLFLWFLPGMVKRRKRRWRND